MNTVVGLYGNVFAADQAVEKLMEGDLDHDLMVVHVERQREPRIMSAERVKRGTGTAAGGGDRGRRTPTSDHTRGSKVVADRIKNAEVGELTRALLSGGFRSAEAGFFRDSLQRGNTILVFKSKAQDLPKVERAMGEGKILIR